MMLEQGRNIPMNGRPQVDLRRALYIVIGTIAVVIGAIGIFVPLLPTTPFLLLAAVCYGRSSQKLYKWLISNKWCGRYIRRYRQGQGVTTKMKAVTIALLWLTILSSVFCVVSNIVLEILLVVIAIGVTIHILVLPTFDGRSGKTGETVCVYRDSPTED